MYYNKLRISNIRGFSDKFLEFQEGLNVVFGPNESGKSTALDSMLGTLFGFTQETISRFIKYGNTKGSVALTFTLKENETCDLKREYTLPLAYSEEISMTLNEKMAEAHKEDVDRVLFETIGFSDRIIFENTMIIRQDEIETLKKLDLKSKLKNYIEQNLSGVPNRTADEILSHLRDTLTIHRNELSEIQERKAFLDHHIKKYDSCEKLYYQKKANRNFVENLLREKEEEYASKKNVFDAYAKRKEMERRLEENKKARDDLEGRIASIESNDGILRMISETLPTLRDLDRLKEDEKRAREMFEKRSQELEVESKQNIVLEEKLNAIDREIREIEEELGKNFVARRIDSMRKAKMYTKERKNQLMVERDKLMNEYQALRQHIETMNIYIDTNRRDLDMILFKKNNLISKLPEAMRSASIGDIVGIQEKVRREQSELMSEGNVSALNEKLNIILNEREDINKEWEKISGFKIEISDFEPFQEEIKELEIIVSHNRENKKKLEEEIVPLEKDLAFSKEEAKEELRNLEERKKKVEEGIKVDEKILEFLEEANEEIKERLLPELEMRVAELMSRITNGRYTDLKIDKSSLDSQVYSEETGTFHDTDFLSQGTKDQLYLCLRIAFTEFLTGSRKIPFVFDDPFDSFDEGRLRNTLEILKEISKQHQIILFTHDTLCKNYGNVIELP